MEDALVSFDQAGRIILPKDIRQELGIKPGDVFRISINGSAITLTPSKETLGLVRKGRTLIFPKRGDEMLTSEMVEQILAKGRD